jgi:gluconate 2-dehydrogenase gamma chain
MKANRREFFFSMAALSVAPPLSLRKSALSLSVTTSATVEKFTDVEKEILGALCEQIVPTDEHPGAKELGSVHFIERALIEAHPEWMLIYKAGLKSTEVCSQELYQKSFTDLEFDQQTDYLKKMERGDLTALNWNGYDPAEFFSMIRDHTFQACYSHPKWGGNKDKLAWKMIGYEDWWV